LEVVKPGCLKTALERLEPCVGKLTSTVLMGLGFSNEPWLPDYLSTNDYDVKQMKKLGICFASSGIRDPIFCKAA